ncbi:hypothetical protein BC937DRAFT_92204 [Endogone sp. FLAS-F59071]|nr:hypothetical protein BC937DRAFT_92204 [Endogone sp. FLAS-F59071]|eukprot:RUS23115.1 hypothetical protein BC937DRAFT_92204 [Endogone sp. FLAS-F59071]
MTRLRSSAATTSAKSDRMSTTSAASIAMSVPEHSATPISAAANAGESLIPSPTIAITCVRGASDRPATLLIMRQMELLRDAKWIVSRCMACTMILFPLGLTPACISSIPICAAILRAVSSWSPVTIAVAIPMACSVATTRRDSGLTRSESEMWPAARPSTATRTHVRPWLSSYSLAARR